MSAYDPKRTWAEWRDYCRCIHSSPGSYTSRIAHRLSNFRRLRHSSDLCAFNDRFSARTQTWDHASARGRSGRGIRNEVRSATQSESLSSRFDMCGPRLSYEDARVPCSPASAPRRRPVCVVRAARRYQESLLPVLRFFRAFLAVFVDSAFAPCRASCANGIVWPQAQLARPHILWDGAWGGLSRIRRG